MIEKETDGYTGQVTMCRCSECGAIWNYDRDECPSCE